MFKLPYFRFILSYVLLGLGACSPSQEADTYHQATDSEPMQSWQVYQDPNNGLYGYRHPETGEVLVNPQYIEALPFANGLAAVCLADTLDHIRTRRWGYINTLGEVQIPFVFSEAGQHLDTLEVMVGTNIIVAPVKFLNQVPAPSDRFYVDLLGTCIPHPEAESNYKEDAHLMSQILYEEYPEPLMANVFFEEGQINLNEKHKQSLAEDVTRSLIGGRIDKVLSGEWQFKIIGYHSSGWADQGTSARRIEVVKEYLQTYYPSLASDTLYVTEDRGGQDAETEIVAGSDRRVEVIFVEKQASEAK